MTRLLVILVTVCRPITTDYYLLVASRAKDDDKPSSAH